MDAGVPPLMWRTNCCWQEGLEWSVTSHSLDGTTLTHGDALVQGVVPNMMKLAPAAGISWLCFEEVKRYLGVDTRT